MNRHQGLKGILISIGLLLMGCVPRFDPDAMQTRAQIKAPLIYETYTVGQTFVSQRPRLCAIEAAWDPTTQPPGPLVLSLRPSPESAQVLAHAEVQPETQQGQAMIHWRFPPLPNSKGQSFYFEISAPQATADHPLKLHAMANNIYKPGQAHANGIPRTGDLTFYTFYDYNAALLLQDILKGLTRLWLIFPFIALCIAPGTLLLQLWPSAQRTFDIWSYIGIAFGLSLAISPWILLWVTQLGGTLLPLATHFLYWGCATVMLIHLIFRWVGAFGQDRRPSYVSVRRPSTNKSAISVRRPSTNEDEHVSVRRPSTNKSAISVRRPSTNEDEHVSVRRPSTNESICNPTDMQRDGLLLALILSVGLVVRLLAIRDLAFPAWVDSVHHALLTRMIYEHGQVPTTYAPYIPATPAIYHYGFQAHVALFMRLSGLDLPQAMLWVGQCFNAGMALQVYLLARWLTQRRWTALFAALCVAILGTMPAFYVTWGRYTQLAGLLILPVALILSVETVKSNDADAFKASRASEILQRAILTILTLAGLILTHYRVFAFYVCFVGAWWLVNTLGKRRWLRQWRTHLQVILSYVGIGIAAILLLMPWILGIARQLWLPAVFEWSQQNTAATWDFSWRYVSGGLDRYLLTLGALGLLVGLSRLRCRLCCRLCYGIKRGHFAGVVGVWISAMFVITNPSRFGLPGEGLINNVTMLITWFIPMAIGSGFLLDTLVERWRDALSPRLWPWGIGFLSVALLTLSSIGIRQQITVVEPQNLFALQADREALTWVQTHTPPESHFYINTQPWQNQIYVGSDGGYWIAPLAGRTTVTPPALYPLSNLDNPVQKITELAQRAEAEVSDPARLAKVLREADANYVYIGALGGSLDPDVLRAAPMFDLRYENERVTIFAVRAATSSTD